MRLISSLVPMTMLSAGLWLPTLAAADAEPESAAAVLEEVVMESGPEAAWIRFREMGDQGPERFRFDEGEINSLGYRLIHRQALAAAIEIFRMNAERFPESWNVWDSLGEGYLFAGREAEARESLMRAQKLLYPEAEDEWRLNDRVEGKIFNYRHETKTEARFEPGEQTGLQGPYLGQDPPGLEPEVFAPGIVSTPRAQEFSSTVSPDGREFYFNRDGRIMVSRWHEEGWTAPKAAWFNTPELNHEPHITADGKRLYFGSGRPRPDRAAGEQSYGIWMMEKGEAGWGEPMLAFDGMYVTTTRDGTIYVSLSGPDGRGVGVIEVEGDSFGEPRLLGPVINEPQAGVHPGVAPDGSFLIFDSARESGFGKSDLYVSFRQADGSWGPAVNLGETLNTPSTDYCASVTPDGKYLFYRSRNDLYWVDVRVLDRFRN